MIKKSSLKPMETFDKVPAGYKRNSFTAYENYFEPLKSLPDNERLAAYDAIVAYALNGEEIIDPVKNPIANMVFGILKPYLYNDRVKSYNGKKGGAPVGSKNNPHGRGAKRTNQELTENLPKTNLKLSEVEVEDEVEVDEENEVEIEDKTIEEVSPIVVVDKNNNKPLLAKVPVKTQWDSLGSENNPQKATGFELKNFSPVEVVKNFDNGNLPYKSVLITAYKVFSNHTGTDGDKWRKSVDECKNLYWKDAVNCVYFTGADIASILKVGVAIDNVIKLVGKQPAMESVFKIMQSVCIEGKYENKPIEEKTRILIGSINKFEKDCK